MSLKTYHYVTKGNHVLQEGIYSFSKSPHVDLNFYTKRSGQNTQQGISQWMENMFSGYSRGVRCFSEPVQATTQRLQDFIQQSNLFEIDVEKLAQDGLLESVYVSPALPPKEELIPKALKSIEEEGTDGFIKLQSYHHISDYPVDWNVCNDEKGWRFAFVPFFLLVLKEGIIPPQYLKQIK